jgi:hypothetical protein
VKRRNFLFTAAALAGAPALPQFGATQAANGIRSVQRLFTSDIEDKPWFHDREMWPRYFAMLAENQFNRFQLSFGIGYDFLRAVTDAYFLFAYPFLLSVPGYNVRAVNLPDAERDRNLETLRFIGEQAAAHGLQFQLGLWMHGYVWENSPTTPLRVSTQGTTAPTAAMRCLPCSAPVPPSPASPYASMAKAGWLKAAMRSGAPSSMA